MRLYNSLTKKLEFIQTRDEKVSVYVCGITPYDTTHLGHAFTYTSIDILIRFLEFKGYHVLYAQNVTDIDDEILRKAKEVKEDWQSLGNRWTAHFMRDMQSLNVRPPDFYPRATEVIGEIIATVRKLLEVGVGYVSGGSVFFDVHSWPKFGELNGLSWDEMLPIANERGNKPDDPKKRDPLDFVLWQAQAPGEPSWESPWGPGRPGWHIECSTMSTKFLGQPVDIHGGGADLCFPHHECEIAQVDPLDTGQPFVHTWVHTAMVYHDGAKMSKSLGNLVMIRDLLRVHSPDALRLYLGKHHYRASWSHSKAELEEAANLAKRMKESIKGKSGTEKPLHANGAWADFIAAMEEDLNTPAAYSTLVWLVEMIEEGIRVGRDVCEAQEALRAMGSVFGLRIDKEAPEPHVLAGWEKHLQRFKD